jgi:hypothetical protein
VGCTREYLKKLEHIALPSLEEIEEAWRTGKKLPWDDWFYYFCVGECEGRIYCTEDYSCPWHDYGECRAVVLFSGFLCPEHFEQFRGEDFGDYFRNIAKADPELFDRTRTVGGAR